jgi:hypothetical protein
LSYSFELDFRHGIHRGQYETLKHLQGACSQSSIVSEHCVLVDSLNNTTFACPGIVLIAAASHPPTLQALIFGPHPTILTSDRNRIYHHHQLVTFSKPTIEIR